MNLQRNEKGRFSKTHGMRYISGYGSWKGLMNRCYNINCLDYKDYGARGIKVCDRWRESPVYFFEDMGPRPSDKTSIDRLDENDDYKPNNCRWADQAEQNESCQNNKIVIAWGEINSLIRWVKDPRCKTDIDTLKRRLASGWKVEEAIETPSGVEYPEYFV